ncbi:MAG: hypothetical protein HY907_18650 [Deltaproteobacteria bacterium]|nr:hypothetical protein [Deltaproteobacteria bacterium]
MKRINHGMFLTVLALLAAAVLAAGCSEECKHSSDCPAGQLCQSGTCVVPDVPDGVGDEATGADGDARDDAGADGDEDGAGPDADDDGGADGDEDVVGPDADADADDDGGTGADADADGDGDGGCTTATECADDNPCTADECLAAEGTCRHTPLVDGMPCSDGLFCNGFEYCLGGACSAPGGAPCAAGPACLSGGCDEDTDLCSTDPAPDGTACDNGIYCDGTEQCLAGFCESSGSPCTAGDGICTISLCDEGTHACSTTTAPDGTNCDDGDICNGSDVCGSGVCVLDPVPPCVSYNTCEVGVCSPDGGGGVYCTWAPAPAGTTCTETGVPCVGSAGRMCAEGESSVTMCAAGTDAPCSDGSLCDVTYCDRGTCNSVSPRPTPAALACGGEVRGWTATGANDVSNYGVTCGGGYDGGERVYAVAVPSGTTTLEVLLTASGFSGTPAVLILSDHCSATSCLATSGTGTTVTATVTGGRTYYVVVDGQTGGRGGFRLNATCR